MENKVVCYRNRYPRPDLVGKQYGQWTILEDIGTRIGSYNGNRYVLAQCTCGSKKEMYYSNLTRNNQGKCLDCSSKVQCTEAVAARLNKLYDNPDPYLRTVIGDWVLFVRIYIDDTEPGYYGVMCVNQLHSTIKNIHQLRKGKGLICRECTP